MISCCWEWFGSIWVFLHDQNRNSRLRLCTLCVLTIFLKYRFSFTIVPWLSLGGPGCLLRLWSQDFGYERTWTVVQWDSTSAVKTFKRSTVVEMGKIIEICYFIQIILCQKHSFLHQLTQTDCSLNYKLSTRKL